MNDAEESRLVQRFYEEAWNRWDDDVVDALLAEDFEFRARSGTKYMDGRSGVAIGTRSAAPYPTYTGHLHGALLGRQGRGQPIAYAGAAFFHCAGGRLTSVWVLGDLDPLRRQVET
jgi:hypothetical protein